MDPATRQAHWEKVWAENPDDDLSWTQRSPLLSVGLIRLSGADPTKPVIDVGGGSSTLVDRLVRAGFTDVVVLDISEAALRRAMDRLDKAGDKVEWLVGDVLEVKHSKRYVVWHDRAVFHFLTDEIDRAAYVATMSRAVRPGGVAILATFALDGPETCSGLPVQRYDAKSLAAAVGPGWTLEHDETETHITPWGDAQRFTYAMFRHTPGPSTP